MGDIADLIRDDDYAFDDDDDDNEDDDGIPFLHKRSSLATVAWVAVHHQVLPDFRRRGLASYGGHANHIIMLGWSIFDVDPVERVQFAARVLGRAVQVDSVKSRVESACEYGFSA